MRSLRRARAAALASTFAVTMLGVAVVQPSNVSALNAHAQLDPSGALLETFDLLARTGTSSLLPIGADFVEAGTNANESYAAGTGSSNSGNTYSFGATDADDRAWGGLLSGSLAPTIGYAFDNASGATITALTIAYRGEQWRLGTAGRADRLDAQYSLDATSLTDGTWTDIDGLDFSSPVTVAPTGALDGNATANQANVSATIADLSVATGTTVFLRWRDVDASGADDGLAIDDLSIVATLGGPGGNAPVARTCPAAISTPAGVASGAAISASDPDGTVVAAAIDGGGAPGITLVDVVPAGADGGTLTASLDVSATTAPGTYPVVVTFANDDDPAQTTSCTITVGVVPTSARIHDIQQATHVSSLDDSEVTGVPGIVTARRSNGFYLQDPQPDSSPATSEGIFVFTSAAPTVAVGDSVLVSGVVSEFRPTSVTGPNLTTTEITGPVVVVLSSGNPLPAATTIGAGGLVPPTTTIDDDPTASVEDPAHVFDPTRNGIDFYESLEGMLVTVREAAVTDGSSPTVSNGEIPVVPGGVAVTGVRSPRGALLVGPYVGSDVELSDPNPERVLLDDEVLRAAGGTMPAADVGDVVAEATGPVDYSFGNFKVEVTSVPTVARNGLVREVGLAAPSGGISIATYNVENLASTEAQAKFDALAAQIVTNLQSPDLIIVEEIQDNDGSTAGPSTDASLTYAKLIGAIASLGGPTYSFAQIDPVAGADGGQPGGNIRVGFLYRSDRGLAFVNRPGGDATTATTVVNNAGVPQLSASPGRIDPTDVAWTASRKPLVGEFTYQGRTIFVIGNHFNSKGGDDPLFGRFQPPTRVSEVQRNQQAAVVHDFVAQITAIDPDANVVVAGDLNDFTFSDTLTILKGDLLINMFDTLPAEEQYDYIFEGNAQTLDHILVTPALKSAGSAVFDVVHVNSEYGDQLSDHDPELLLLDFTPKAQTITFSAPSTGVVGSSAPLIATGGASGNPVTFSVDPSSGPGVCAVSGTTVTYIAPGTCVIAADQAGNQEYAAAATVTRSIAVSAPPAPAFSVSDTTVTEGNRLLFPPNLARFTVTRSGNTAVAASVSVATLIGLGGTNALVLSDFLPVLTRVSFAPGETTKVVAVPIVGDRQRERDETLRVLLYNPSAGASIARPIGVGTIVNDD